MIRPKRYLMEATPELSQVDGNPTCLEGFPKGAPVVAGGLRKKGLFKHSYWKIGDSWQTKDRSSVPDQLILDEDKTSLPLLSVITVVYNADETLATTIKSVLQQTYPNIELIVIDGGSSDGTIDIIQSFDDAIDFWTSGPDSGIYDAMNKGIAAARGDGILFLNAGDCFVGNLIAEAPLIPSFLPVVSTDIFGRSRQLKLKSHRRGLPNCHQGIIFENKNVRYDLNYRVAADYDFYLRHEYDDKLPMMIADRKSYVCYDNAGFSQKNFKKRDAEIYTIIKRYFGQLDASLFLIHSKIKELAKTFLKLAT